PTVRTAVEVLRLEPLAEAETLDVARRWSETRGTDGPIADERMLTEAWQLSQQFQSSMAAPGNLLDLLERTRVRLAAEGRDASLGTEDMVETLTATTGLPAAIVDERATLDLDQLQAFFEGRVMGQPEAVDVLVRRIAMIKAGVTDPTRPLGVFLFAGPTGTGKTEIAKALAAYLFGSTDRLIRLDMSEFQVPESLGPILGEPGQPGEGALVDRIRQQPFSVVLLDEFEKAHPQVWDLFLQTFDDGRLTDRQGRTADFRHAIVALTTNLGANTPTGAGFGFSKSAASFDPKAVLTAIHKAFRRELINRLDRVVVFRPLDRATMRAILQKELEDAFERRGLRQRAWAVEWEDSAIEFLLEQGFTVDLGARPLKRAIEHHLLAPLAMTIVEHRFPEGDQFLFVRADDDGLSVEFVDPDADDGDVEVWDSQAPPAELEPGGIALQPRGTAGEVACLRSRYERLQSEAQSEEWQAAKQAALASMAEDGFWSTTERYEVLRGYEYRDRIEVALSTAGRMLRRLGRGSRHPRALVARLAQQIYLVDHACTDVREGRKSDCFLLVEQAEQTGTEPGDRQRFFQRLRDMYTSWGRQRRMQTEVLADDPERFVMAVTGFGAWTILAPEHGLHVEESPREKGRRFNRATVRVRVAARPDEPAAPGSLQAQALKTLDRPGKLEVVRRYRHAPSPLVRDSVRGWRTGRVDQVLGGNFDLVG
ncbi:MAG: ATP-dependent Clp protease ATP-binding subunit, partial [Deltaproteobacteria bacterium]|nr:ATP-dependent Clp protease ATP-binding subunit [Deltaproteobacteria bacterium]